MKKLLIVTVLTVCLTLNAKIIRAGCITYGSTPYAGECNAMEYEYAQDYYYAMYDGNTYLRAWGLVTEDGPNGNNNVTLIANDPSSAPGPWPSYTQGTWTVVVSNMSYPSDLQSGGDEVVTNQYDPYRTSGQITLTAISTFASSGWGYRNLCRGGVLASW